MKVYMEQVYEKINHLLGNVIRPGALWARNWIQKRRNLRADRKERFIAGLLNFKIQGEEVVNVPNFFSLLRPFLVLIAVIMDLYAVPRYFTLSIIAIALATDKVDGAWAEIDGKTAFGAFLDPICDKISLFIIAIYFFNRIHYWIIFPLLTIEVMLFIIALVGFFLQGTQKKERTDFRSNIFGKVKFFIQSLGIIAIAIQFIDVANYLFLFSILFAVVSIAVKVYTLAKP